MGSFIYLFFLLFSLLSAGSQLMMLDPFNRKLICLLMAVDICRILVIEHGRCGPCPSFYLWVTSCDSVFKRLQTSLLKDYRHLFYWHRISTTLRHLFCRMWMNPQEHGITCASHTSWQRSGCFLFKTPREDVMTRMDASCMFLMTTYSTVTTTKHHLSQRFTITVRINMIKYQSILTSRRWLLSTITVHHHDASSVITLRRPWHESCRLRWRHGEWTRYVCLKNSLKSYDSIRNPCYMIVFHI